MEGHFHSGTLVLLHLLAGMIVINFLARGWSGLNASKPWAQGLAHVL